MKAKSKRKSRVSKKVKCNKTPHPTYFFSTARQILTLSTVLATLFMETLDTLIIGKISLTHPTRYISLTARQMLTRSTVLATVIWETLDILSIEKIRLTHPTRYPLLFELKRRHIYSNVTDTVPGKGSPMLWKIKGFLATFRCEKCKVGTKISWCIIKKFIFRQGDKNCKYCHIVGLWELYGPNNGRGLSEYIIQKSCTACGLDSWVLLPRH